MQDNDHSEQPEQPNTNRQRGANHWTQRRKLEVEAAQALAEQVAAHAVKEEQAQARVFNALAEEHSAKDSPFTETGPMVSVPVEPVELGMTERDRYHADVERVRKLRKPRSAFGSLQQKLALDKRPGYHRHWFNDTPGRIDEAKASGWTHVQDSDGRPTKRIVGQGRDRGGLLAYAMELPEVFWEEDMAHQAELAKRPLDAIKGNPVSARPGQSKQEDNSKFYSPREQILDIQRK